MALNEKDAEISRLKSQLADAGSAH